MMRFLVSELDLNLTKAAKAFEVIWFRSDSAYESAKKLFSDFETDLDFLQRQNKNLSLLVRHQHLGVLHPKTTSLAKVLRCSSLEFEVDEILVFEQLGFVPSKELVAELEWTWKEPAIENIRSCVLHEYVEWRKSDPQPKPIKDDSWSHYHPDELGLPFTEDEKKVLLEKEQSQGRRWTRAEWELFAQTWSEHCKHKIFNAEIDLGSKKISSVFKTFIRNPSLKIAESRSDCLSMFHDNAGVVRVVDYNKKPTSLAVCAKMETHNSPSAISPFGGAATGVVGVHRDILGTGLGAKPIANWNVLCFESEVHASSRPSNALPPRVIRSGVLRGIEVGGNHSGIPTVQGSVHFAPEFAVKPYVFAGALGLMGTQHVNKKPKVGAILFCLGGATGIDGVRGAVMSSRSITDQDFSGSAVQVANPFVQRMLTDFLLRARDLGLIDSITDNGAGGLASSVGEMAQSTGGAKIDLSSLRLKVKEIPAWVRLLSESQERMTVATTKPQEFESLARSMQIEFDLIGELTNSGRFEVTAFGKSLVSVELEFLHDACPRLNLKTNWTKERERSFLKEHRNLVIQNKLLNSHQEILNELMGSPELCSREGIVRRFDHEVQGRTLKKPYAGLFQKNPSQGSVVDLAECAESGASMVLSHATLPEAQDVLRSTEIGYFEALSKAVVSGAQIKTLAGLDNFAWPDPTSDDRSLWQLVESCEILSKFSLEFKIPFVSGKDSMKNNSEFYRAKPAVVISMFGSGVSPELIPSGYLQRSNDVVAILDPLAQSLFETSFERICGLKAISGVISDYDYVSLDVSLIEKAKSRLLAIESLISTGSIRSIRAIGASGPLGALAKMSFGTPFGYLLHESFDSYQDAYGEGVAGFVMTLDPHCVEEVFGLFNDLRRLGVVATGDDLMFGNGQKVDLRQVEIAYTELSSKGLWS